MRKCYQTVEQSRPFRPKLPLRRVLAATVKRPLIYAHCEVGLRTGVARGGLGSHAPQLLEHIFILCFERRFSKQNSTIRLKSNTLTPKFLGWLRHWVYVVVRSCFRWRTTSAASKSPQTEVCNEAGLLQFFIENFFGHRKYKYMKSVNTLLE